MKILKCCIHIQQSQSFFKHRPASFLSCIMKSLCCLVDEVIGMIMHAGVDQLNSIVLHLLAFTESFNAVIFVLGDNFLLGFCCTFQLLYDGHVFCCLVPAFTLQGSIRLIFVTDTFFGTLMKSALYVRHRVMFSV